ncbi:MAG: type II toxin-antitoxin system VapC family toxin [Phenylobacterium sp.]|nr:type II toxin-antitoxin system VapC family toxin [Phenylobacterium sp.]
MIALDTNVLVRYLVGDDVQQAETARRIIEDVLTPAEPGFVSLIVLVELSWVLGRVYRCPHEQIASILAELLASPTIHVEQPAAVSAAINHRHDDLADSLLHETGRLQGCARTVTFDRKFARLPGVELAG